MNITSKVIACTIVCAFVATSSCITSITSSNAFAIDSLGKVNDSIGRLPYYRIERDTCYHFLRDSVFWSDRNTPETSTVNIGVSIDWPKSDSTIAIKKIQVEIARKLLGFYDSPSQMPAIDDILDGKFAKSNWSEHTFQMSFSWRAGTNFKLWNDYLIVCHWTEYCDVGMGNWNPWHEGCWVFDAQTGNVLTPEDILNLRAIGGSGFRELLLSNLISDEPTLKEVIRCHANAYSVEIVDYTIESEGMRFRILYDYIYECPRSIWPSLPTESFISFSELIDRNLMKTNSAVYRYYNKK